MTIHEPLVGVAQCLAEALSKALCSHISSIPGMRWEAMGGVTGLLTVDGASLIDAGIGGAWSGA